MFRKVKKKLLKQDKFFRYLTYAIGEIILIVIGILIAVSIKNANEERQRTNTVNSIYANIITDLKRDTTEVQYLLDIYRGRKAIFEKVMNNTLTNEEVIACEGCINLITSLDLLSIDQRGFQQLKQYVRGTDSLTVDIITFYTKFNEFFETYNDILIKYVNGTLSEWRDTYPWFATLVRNETNEASLSYFGRSQEYKNKVAYGYVFIYHNYVGNLKEFQSEAEILLKDLNNRLDNN